jgi:hypothetical protein
MSKSSGFAPTPQAMSRPGSPAPSLGGYDKTEDRQALMMGPLGETRRPEKVDKDALAQAQPGAKDQGKFKCTGTGMGIDVQSHLF